MSMVRGSGVITSETFTSPKPGFIQSRIPTPVATPIAALPKRIGAKRRGRIGSTASCRPPTNGAP